MTNDKKPEYGYELALKLAREQVAAIRDVKEQCRRAGAQHSGGKVTIEYLGRPCSITLPDAEVSPTEGTDSLPIREKILILHYFARAKGTPLSGQMVTYKELPEAPNYYPVFRARAIKPLLDNFGAQPEKLLGVGAGLGGKKADFGDVAVSFDAFPRVPVVFALWKGDDEFPPDGNVLFDSSVPDYLTTDDTNVLCETIAWRLVRLLKSASKS